MLRLSLTDCPKIGVHFRDTQPELGFQRVLQRAVFHVQSSGKKEVSGANVLVAIFGEGDSHAVQLLREQDITRLEVVNYISSGITALSDNEVNTILRKRLEECRERQKEYEYQENGEEKNEGDLPVAIDFGTSRTKVGWRDENGEVRLLDWDGVPYLPSVFHLPTGETDVLVGKDAVEALLEDPLGGIENLKRSILDGQAVMAAHPDRTDKEGALVFALFSRITEACQHQVFDGKQPSALNLTLSVPADPDVHWRMLLEQAAQYSFGVAIPQAIQEPVAAARSYLAEQGWPEMDLVVLDCGGGTTDFALLHASEGADPKLSTQIRMKQLNLGGCDVDVALLHYLQTHHQELIKPGSERSMLIKLREYKESSLSETGASQPLRIGGRQTRLDASEVKRIYTDAFAAPLLSSLDANLEQIRKAHPDIQILLVGGNATPTLAEEIQRAWGLTVELAQNTGLAVIHGSLATPGQNAGGRNKANAKRRANIPDQWDAPDLHELYDRGEIQQWQQEVADRLGLPVIQQHTLKDGTQGPEMVLIPPGKFLMGSPPGEPERNSNEGPQHQVIITRPYWLGRYALTFEHYDHYCEVTGADKANDSSWGRGQRPVINVSWHDAIAYCQWLSKQTGYPYQLPTEAQWEMACRAGTRSPFWFGDELDTDKANYDGTYPYNTGRKGLYRAKTVAVNEFSANPFGLVQMHGNVWEWCNDWYGRYPSGSVTDPEGPEDGGHRVLRGGTWRSCGRNLRSAFRHDVGPGRANGCFGFRLSLGPIEPRGA